MIIFLNLVLSQSNCEEHELQRDAGAYTVFLGNSIRTQSSRKLQSSSHDNIKRYNLNYNYLFSPAFGSDGCVFKQKRDFVGLEQCFGTPFISPELDCNLFWARKISFLHVSAVPITLPVFNKLF